MYSCIYDLSNRQFQGVEEQLAFIVLREDSEEIFFSYGYDSNKAQVLYSFSKHQILDEFVSTAFQKHYNEVMNEKWGSEDYSSLSFYLSLITDRKEVIYHWKGNPSLSPIDFDVSFIESFSSKKEKFQPHLLNSTNFKEREPQTKMLYGLFKHMAQFSNQNLSRNVTYLNIKDKRDVASIEWSVSSSKTRFDSNNFKLTY